MAVIFGIVQFCVEQLFSSFVESLALLHYIFLLVVFVIPHYVGLVVLFTVLFFWLATPKPVFQGQQIRSQRSAISFSPFSPQIGNAFVLEFTKSQRNEYKFQSIFGLHSWTNFPTWILGTILNDYFKPYTTMTVERVLVVVPNLESLVPLVKKSQMNSYMPLQHGQPVHIQKGFLANEKNLPPVKANGSTSGYATLKENLSLDRLEYMDLSLRKYWSSPKTYYKEKKPIHFKFLVDRSISNC